MSADHKIVNKTKFAFFCTCPANSFLLAMIVSIAKIFSTDFQSYARKSQTLQVLTIDYSHFCEFSLWALKEQKVLLLYFILKFDRRLLYAGVPRFMELTFIFEVGSF